MAKIVGMVMLYTVVLNSSHSLISTNNDPNFSQSKILLHSISFCVLPQPLLGILPGPAPCDLPQVHLLITSAKAQS
jgi:hypothetical protein